MIDRFTPIHDPHDPNDPRIEPYRNQKDAWLKAAHNPDATGQPAKESLFISEGSLVLEHHINSIYPLHSVLIAESKLDAHADLLSRVPDDVPIYTAARSILDQITGYPIHRGLLACGRRLPNPDFTQLIGSSRALVILEDLSNHDNLGSVFRSVAALCGTGVSVLLSPRCCDPLYRKALRVSMGHALTVPFAYLPPERNWPSIVTTLSDAGFSTLAMTPAPDALDIDQYIQNQPSAQKNAIFLGAEGPGLTRDALDSSDFRVKIPLASSADSLNISVAAAVALHRLVLPQG